MTYIPNNIRDFFKEESWTFDFKKEKIPTFSNKSQLSNWVIFESKWPYFPLILPNAPYKEMYQEAIQLEDYFNSHRIEDNLPVEYVNRGWSSVCLHGEEWNKTETFSKYPENLGKNESEIEYKWCNEITELCPITTTYFKEEFPSQEYQRLRFMRLEPQGYILPHTDRDRSMLMPVNIALNNPKNCIFRMEGKGDVPFNPEGGACLVDIHNIHSVWNNSETPRIHMIIHFKQDSRIDDIIYESLQSLIS